MDKYNYKTLEYKKIDGEQAVLLDVFFPTLPSTNEVIPLPVVVHFHGGGLLVGNKQSFMPSWLLDRVLALGYVFISADYRLLIPCTAHEIVEDLKDVFTFVANTEIKGDDYTFKLDRDRIAVAGGSAGGLCAYLSAIHCSPKPKVLVNLYGSGGDYFTEHRLSIKPGDFTWMGQNVPHLDASAVSDIIYPYSKGLPKVETDVPVSLGLLSSNTEKPETKQRMTAITFLFQEGNNMDYYTGIHDPSIAGAMRAILDKGNATLDDFKQALPEDKHSLFPLLSIDSKWPPSIILHGTNDDVVKIESSINIRDALEKVGVAVELREIEGRNHGFDVFPGAEEEYKAEFDRVKNFIQRYL